MDQPSEPSNGKVRVNIWITKSMYDFLMSHAASDARSMSHVMRVALKEFMLKEQRRNRNDEEG